LVDRAARANAFSAAGALPTRSSASPRNIIEPWRSGRMSSSPASAVTAPCASPALSRHTPNQCSDSPAIGSSALAWAMVSAAATAATPPPISRSRAR
jgi:hypothetical protein